jgi:glycosyltransferase involved in cell wall biosynthesis
MTGRVDFSQLHCPSVTAANLVRGPALWWLRGQALAVLLLRLSPLLQPCSPPEDPGEQGRGESDQLMTSKKVLIIVENLPVPFDTRVWREARSLHENGYEVTVLCPRGKGYERRHEVIAGVHIYRHPMATEGNGLLGYLAEYGCALFWQLLYAWWIYFRRGFHVIQGCNPPDTIFLVALPFKLVRVRYIFDHHDANPELYLSKFGRKGLVYRAQLWLEKLTYRSSDVVMSTNASYRNLALTRGGVNSKDVFIVRNGPDLETFKPVAPNPALRHGKRYLIGYVGTMSVQEGLDILLEVALHLKNLGRRDIHFTCVGGGPGLPGLRKMVREKGLEDLVNFTGRVSDEDLLAILSTADVCVNPDKPCEMNNISTMIKIMEYMTLGKPIVQFDLREGRESAREASLYADSGNQAGDFASKILWLLDHPAERQRMGEFGRKRVENELAWEYSVEGLLAAYGRAFTKGMGSKQASKRPTEGKHEPIPKQKTPAAASAGAPDLRAP